MLSYALIAGVLFGLYFSLVGIGLNLVFGVMRIVNLAHGDCLMLGAFIAVGIVALVGIDPLFAVPLAFVIFLIVKQVNRFMPAPPPAPPAPATKVCPECLSTIPAAANNPRRDISPAMTTP